MGGAYLAIFYVFCSKLRTLNISILLVFCFCFLLCFLFLFFAFVVVVVVVVVEDFTVKDHAKYRARKRRMLCF